MRRAGRGALVLAVLASFSGTAVATASPPALAGQTLVVAFGTASVDVAVPRGGAELVERLPANGSVPGFAAMFSATSWSAVALISRTARHGDRPLHHVQVHAPAPDHCPSTVAPTVQPVPTCTPYVEHTYHHSPAARVVGETNRWRLAPGTYQLVVSAPPGRVVTAALTFAGLRGSRVLFASKRVAATFERDRVENVALAHLTGSYEHRIASRGLGVLGVWHTTAGDEPGEYAYAECVVPGDADQANPDDCPVRDTAPAPVPGGKDPVFAAQSMGAHTVDNSGNDTFETRVLAKGTYTNTYRVTRGGRGPGVGTWVWWLEADSVK